MSWFKTFFSSDGDAHQVIRTGSVLNDTSTGRTGFVISDDQGSALISDDRGGLHQVIKTGSMSYDTTTGKSWFEI